MQRLFMVIFTVFLIQGCTLGHQEFYTQVAPTKYPPTEKTRVFEYSDVDLKELYNLLFSDYLIIGNSAFNGPYEDPNQSVSFANSIGAEVFLATSQFKETRTSFMPLTTPTTSTTYVSGYSGSRSFSGTATNYGTQTTNIPITVNRYRQDGLYLRNVNKIEPLWEKTDAQYQKTEATDLEGVWFNENYRLNLYRSGEQMVAFIAEVPKDVEGWNKGQLKFVYGVDSDVGVYLMGNKSPMPAKFKLNKFGHLEVSLISSQEIFSFTR
ncbi:MAG: hypothetical protein AB9919_07890 [Geobacteraceae bacterium]